MSLEQNAGVQVGTGKRARRVIEAGSPDEAVGLAINFLVNGTAVIAAEVPELHAESPRIELTITARALSPAPKGNNDE